jgi:hypothetical protein
MARFRNKQLSLTTHLCPYLLHVTVPGETVIVEPFANETAGKTDFFLKKHFFWKKQWFLNTKKSI